MWPTTSDSENPMTSTTDTSDTDKLRPPSHSSVSKGSMIHNLNGLKRKPITQARLSQLRERVRVDIGNITIAEPALKKPKIEILDVPTDENRDDLGEFIGRQIKRLRVASDLSNEDSSPVKKRQMIEPPIQNTAYVPNEEPTIEKHRVIRTARRSSSVPQL